MRFAVRLGVWGAFALVMALLLSACGSSPTATPTATPTAAPTNTPTPTLAPGVPTPTPIPATATPTPTPTPSFNGDAYFAGKTITMITGTSPGGGYDTMLRIFGKIAPKYFPKGTRFVVQNIPGAGQLRGLEAVLTAKPDGLTIGPTHQRFFIEQAVYGDVPNLDFNNVEVVGSPTFKPNPNMACVNKSVATSWQDVIDRGVQLTTGQTAPGNSPGTEFLQLIGAPIKNIYGYGGSAEVFAAFDRGEINTIWSCGPEELGRLYPDLVSEHKVAPLYWWEQQYDNTWLNQLGYTQADVPYILDIPGVNWTDTNKTAFLDWVDISQVSRTFLLPPGVDPNILQYWRDKFKQVVEDPDFIQSTQVAGYADQYGYAGGPEIEKKLQDLQALPQSVKDILKNIAPQLQQ